MFGLNDNNNKSADSGGSLPADNSAPMPANPFGDSAVGPTPPPVAPALEMPTPLPTATDIPKADNASSPNDLVGLKSQALGSLQPLVGHLDQSPEEKFKTTMMLIQATDNPSLVKQAYETANQITDEKARAQALLDVVNEINYFTQRGKDAAAKA